MFLSYQLANADSGMWNRYLRAGLLALCLGLFSAAAWAWETVLFEDHFDDESSLENWEFALPRDGIQDEKLFLSSCQGNPHHCKGKTGDNYAILKWEPQNNFEFSVKLHDQVAHIFLRATATQAVVNTPGVVVGGTKAYGLTFDNSGCCEPTVPVQFDHVALTNSVIHGPSSPWAETQTIAETKFAAVEIPATARILANGGTIKVFLDGKQVLTYTDPDPLPPGRIGLGPCDKEEFTFMMFDDVILKALPDLRCSPDSTVDGKDRPCEGGLFDNKLWAYLGPDDERIAQVDFYLDGKFQRSEFRPPFELDGGRVSKLLNGPHEVKAKVFYRNGTRASFTAGFEVGEHSLRCSPDPVLDGNDGACEGGTFDAPTWVYWWPENGVKSVNYSVDGVLHRTERKAPFELDGGATSAFSGSVIRAVVQFKDGRKPLMVETHASWAIAGEESLICSTDAVFDGGTDTDFPCSWGLAPEPVHAYLWPEDGIRYVDFYLNGTFHRTERYAPFELDGGAKTQLPVGVHDITAIVHYADEGKPTTAIRTPVSVP